MRRSFRILDRDGSDRLEADLFKMAAAPDERAGNVSVLTNATLGKNGDTCRAYLIIFLCNIALVLSSRVAASCATASYGGTRGGGTVAGRRTNTLTMCNVP